MNELVFDATNESVKKYCPLFRRTGWDQISDLAKELNKKQTEEINAINRFISSYVNPLIGERD